MTRQRALRLAREWSQGHVCSLRDGEAAEYHSMFAAMLEESMPNEPLTLETVAEILAEQFGDVCACNVNGNDEWLPMMCHYGDVCPDPPEHLGCWMELLRNKYRRPPEGEEDT